MYFCPSTKSFSNFDLIWCVGGPRPNMRIKVKVKVTELLKFQKLHFSRYISSAIFAWSSKLMAGSNSMGRGLQLVWARFLNFLLGKLSREFRLYRMSLFYKIQMTIFRYCVTLQSHGCACCSATGNSRLGIPVNLRSLKFPAGIPGNFEDFPKLSFYSGFWQFHIT